jgi:prepilin-type N-terminal cleavage/methylation domain-containing protein
VNRVSDNRELLRGRGGFTLIEIMIAVAILSIALAAVFSTFDSQHKSYVVQNGVAQMQENVRGGMLYIEDELRNAASIPSLNLSLPPALFGGSVPISLVSGLGVADGGVGGPDGIFIISLQSGQTTLASNSGESVPVQADTDVASLEGWEAGDLAIVYDGTNASFVFVTGVQDSPTRFNHHSIAGSIFGQNKLNYDYGVGTSVARIRYSGYSIDNSTPAHPRLLRTYLDNNANFTSDIVADDIEDMQLLLGIYDNTTGAITEKDGSWFTGANASQLASVRQIRIQLVGRMASPDPAWTEGSYYNARYNRTGGIAGYDHHRRRSIEQVIYLRNTGVRE